MEVERVTVKFELVTPTGEASMARMVTLMAYTWSYRTVTSFPLSSMT